MISTHPAETRAVRLPWPLPRKTTAIADLARHLVDGGANTLVYQLMDDGRLSVRRRGGRIGGPLCDLLDQSLPAVEASHWLEIDPLSAGPDGGELSGLATQRREWLMRNTRGHTSPLGAAAKRPLFGWMNAEFRRFVGDHLVDVLTHYPIHGVLLDLRQYPGLTKSAERWFCCSYESQRRAERELGIDFETLLMEGSQEEIEAWRSWTLTELGVFVEFLRGRVAAVRSDISWRVRLPAPGPQRRRRELWSTCIADELLEGAVVDARESEDLAGLSREIASAAGRPPVALLAFGTAKHLHDAARTLRECSVAGILLDAPEPLPSGLSAPPFPMWETRGALEDHPLEAAYALVDYLARELGERHLAGRYYRRLRHKLWLLQPEDADVGSLLDFASRIDQRLEAKGVQFPAGLESLRRQAHLVPQMMRLIRTPLPNV